MAESAPGSAGSKLASPISLTPLGRRETGGALTVLTRPGAGPGPGPGAGGGSPAPGGEPAPAPRISWWTVIGGSFIAIATVLMLFFRQSDAVKTLSLTFVGIVLEALPFVMLGSLLSGLVEVFISRERLASVLPRRPILAILMAGGLGMLLPVCECAIIPVTRRLLRKGVPLAAAVAYLLAGPIVNPLVAGSTLVAYAGSWSVTLLRLGLGYGVAVSIAIIMARVFPGTSALREGGLDAAEKAHACSDGCGHDHDHAQHAPAHAHTHTHDACCGHDHAHGHSHSHAHDHAGGSRSFGGKLLDVLHHAADDFLYVGQFLIVGAWLAAACQIERNTVAALAQSPILGIPVMMVLAIMLNLCSEADAFVAFSFRHVATLPAQLAFLVLGPMLDLKLTAMYLTFMRKRAFFTLAALIFGIVLLVMLGLHALMVTQTGSAMLGGGTP
jgi:uncharacterized membrane protein YraQ (UPF0718 family)